jgi:hypothetical protein
MQVHAPETLTSVDFAICSGLGMEKGFLMLRRPRAEEIMVVQSITAAPGTKFSTEKYSALCEVEFVDAEGPVRSVLFDGPSSDNRCESACKIRIFEALKHRHATAESPVAYGSSAARASIR